MPPFLESFELGLMARDVGVAAIDSAAVLVVEVHHVRLGRRSRMMDVLEQVPLMVPVHGVIHE